MAMGVASIAVGAGAAIIGSTLLPKLGGAVKAVAKNAIKGGLLAYRGTVALSTGATDAIKSIALEAKSEMQKAETKQESASTGKTKTVKKQPPAETPQKTGHFHSES